MKYRFKSTNEIVDVISWSCPLGTTRDRSVDCVTYFDDKGNQAIARGFNIYLDFEPVDEEDEKYWEIFRREAALRIIASNLSNGNLLDVPDFQVKGAIKTADKLIRFLKEYKYGELQ